LIKNKVAISIIAILLLLNLPSFALGEPNTKTQKTNEAKKIKNQIEQIDQELDEAVEQYNQANCELGEIRSELQTTAQKIAKAEQDLGNQKSVLGKRIRNIYKHGDVPFVETILSTKSFEEFLCTLSHLQDIACEDARIVNDIENLKKEVETKRQVLAEQEKSQQAVCGQLATKKSEINKKLSEREGALSGVEAEIAAITREEQAESEKLRARAEADRAKSPQVSRGGGHLPAPKSGVVGIAMQQLGKPYRWGAAGPDAFDCSGLVMYCYARVGVSLPHSAAAQYGCGARVSRDQLQPGDLVFFTKGNGISHVGMYVGGDSYIHAPHTGDVVKISSLSARGSGYVGGVRP